jgi:hypothetical protein
MKTFGLTVLSAALFAGFAQANCYSVYDGKDNVVYRGATSPVDLSAPLQRQVRAIWPDGHLVIGQDSRYCIAQDSRASAPMPKLGGAAAPLMDAATQNALATAKKEAAATNARGSAKTAGESVAVAASAAAPSSTTLTPSQNDDNVAARSAAGAAAMSAMLAKRATRSEKAVAPLPATNTGFKTVAVQTADASVDSTNATRTESAAKQTSFRRRGRRG